LTEGRGAPAQHHSRIETKDATPKPITEEMTMKTEMSPRSRSVVSGLTAVAITTVLVSTLVEALNPALLLSGNENAAQQTIASASARRDGTSLPGA
jgi:hypothetical protein